ncbi:hypothetical protein SCAR479_05845 [Seiridium cardinale]|uniref:Uncharacterized protein n=1 Tax=Seiridium cardinale TaxID=138064 RepID=A0ABR2XUN0_9PEZI
MDAGGEVPDAQPQTPEQQSRWQMANAQGHDHGPCLRVPSPVSSGPYFRISAYQERPGNLERGQKWSSSGGGQVVSNDKEPMAPINRALFVKQLPTALPLVPTDRDVKISRHSANRPTSTAIGQSSPLARQTLIAMHGNGKVHSTRFR